MLLRSPEGDAADLAFAEWRAKLPFWNIEADRFRAAALAARRTATVAPGTLRDIEKVIEELRAALQRCDALLAAALPGDHRLTPLFKAATDFESLLESLHASRERIEDFAGSVPDAPGPVSIPREASVRPTLV